VPSDSSAPGGYLDDPDNHFIAFRLDGGEAGDSARSLFIAYNGGLTGVTVSLPAPGTGHRWYLVADTHPWLEADNNLLGPGTEEPVPGGDAPGASYLLGTRSVLLLIEQP
jgi:glycogen operon protein